MLQSQTENKHK